GAALAERVLGERRIDAAVHVRIDEAGERKAVAPVDYRRRIARADLFRDPGKLAVFDRDIHRLHGGTLRAHHAHVPDQKVVFLRGVRHGLGSTGKTLDYAATTMSAAPAAVNT